MQFLKKPPTPGVLNRVLVRPVKKSEFKSFAFHPFIEEFSHQITPKVQQEQFGLFAVSTYYRNGVSDNTFSVTVVLPAVDAEDAKLNYKKVQRFKKLLTPDVSKLQDEVGLVKLSIGKLMKSRVGYITTVNEDFNLDMGFANGYPKIIKLSFTFVVDELYEELFKKKRPIAVQTGRENQNANKQNVDSIAGAAQQSKAKTALNNIQGRNP